VFLASRGSAPVARGGSEPPHNAGPWTPLAKDFAKCEDTCTRAITKRALAAFWEKHAAAENPLRAWYQVTSAAEWHSLEDVRAVYPHADLVGRLTVFNMGGNSFRLIVRIEYERQEVYVRHALAHAEYDREAWKNDPWLQ